MEIRKHADVKKGIICKEMGVARKYKLSNPYRIVPILTQLRTSQQKNVNVKKGTNLMSSFNVVVAVKQTQFGMIKWENAYVFQTGNSINLIQNAYKKVKNVA